MRLDARSGRRKSGAALALIASLSGGAAYGQGPTRNVTIISPLRPDHALAANTAGLGIEILPAAEFEIGAKIGFKVTTKTPGYLILVDVDATGKVTQRYPNLYSMALPQGASETSNLLKPGKAVTIPDPANPFAHFEYVAEAPIGQGMIVALLSAKPVHLVDLPDVPLELLGSQAAADFICEAARNLRIAPRDASAQLADPQWSFAIKFYSIVR